MFKLKKNRSHKSKDRKATNNELHKTTHKTEVTTAAAL